MLLSWGPQIPSPVKHLDYIELHQLWFPWFVCPFLLRQITCKIVRDNIVFLFYSVGSRAVRNKLSFGRQLLATKVDHFRSPLVIQPEKLHLVQILLPIQEQSWSLTLMCDLAFYLLGLEKRDVSSAYDFSWHHRFDFVWVCYGTLTKQDAGKFKTRYNEIYTNDCCK